jgi:hypothetical protein
VLLSRGAKAAYVTPLVIAAMQAAPAFAASGGNGNDKDKDKDKGKGK